MSIENRQCVRSKYFVGKTAMDESLSDFQETKNKCKGPKTTQKVIKTKSRKISKRIKGQKDIRTALKGKKNELVSYTEEFDNVCKKSGIDVDSEQLQIAIALSKSIETEKLDDPSTSKSFTTQGRIGKIRKTLQEYGFKVPEAKITTKTKVKKHLKQYELLNIDQEERHKRIRNKYSQILFETLDYKLNEVTGHDSLTPILSVATNLEYEFMRDNNIFYVNGFANFIEKSTSVGSLLRNWSEIPGRPVSPLLFETNAMDFSEILCSQEELDIILSGPLKSAQKVIETKVIDKDRENINCDIQAAVECKEEHDLIEVDKDFFHITKSSIPKTPTADVKDENLGLVTSSNLTINEYRSCSPDIFDDEVYCTMDTSKPVLSQGQKTILFNEGNTMDLTGVILDIDKEAIMSTNITKVKNDDFMEITECAVTASQGIKETVKEIDLTQSPDEKSMCESNCDGKNDFNYITEIPDCSLSLKHVAINDQITNDTKEDMVDKNSKDCTEVILNCSTDDNNAFACENPPDLGDGDNIDLTQSSNEDKNNSDVNKIQNKNNESLDLTQSSKSSLDITDLPEINLGNTQTPIKNQDDTIILAEEEYLGVDGKVKKVVADEIVFDLTQEREDLNEPKDVVDLKPCSQSFYEDFVYDRSDIKENIENLVENNKVENSDHNTSKESLEIDLTQNSESSTEINLPAKEVTIENIPNNSSLGKKDDMSIDYDEIIEYEDNCNTKENVSFNIDKDNSNFQRNDSIIYFNNDVEIVDNHDLISNSSQSSVVFDLTDKELDYSLHKSRFDIQRDYEAMNTPRSESFEKSIPYAAINKNGTLEDLPDIHFRNTEKIETTANTSTFLNNELITNHDNDKVAIVTPKNSEFIVKTDEVTPMIDYASLTTPQRNKELDKYGLKPFKRKRAIQILTHLYNQTHPVIETYLADENPSPSKKPKQDSSLITQNLPNIHSPREPETLSTIAKSPRKGIIHGSKSPRKSGKSPRKTENNMSSPRKSGISPRKCKNNTSFNSKQCNNSKENLNIYEVTTDIPNIKRIDSDPEDWVFQKREKAKVASCRVPLHIAFHNYVSSRDFLRDAILRYEPINIDVIHKDLVSYGHRYDPKDLLRFLDKKCITVKTADNNARNKR